MMRSLAPRHSELKARRRCRLLLNKTLHSHFYASFFSDPIHVAAGRAHARSPDQGEAELWGTHLLHAC